MPQKQKTLLGGGMLQNRPPVRLDIPQSARDEFEREAQLKNDQFRLKHPYLGGLEDFATSFLGINPDEGQTVFEPPKSNQKPMRLGSALGEAAGFGGMLGIPGKIKNAVKASKLAGAADEFSHLRSVMQPGVMNEYAPVDDIRTISNSFKGTPSPRVELPMYEYRGGGTSLMDPKAAKESGRLMGEMFDVNNPYEKQVKDAFDVVRERYPRAMGNVHSLTLNKNPASRPLEHIGTQTSQAAFNPSFMTRAEEAKLGSMEQIPWGRNVVDRSSAIHLDPEAVFMAQRSRDIGAGKQFTTDLRPQLIDTLTHELTHSGQQQRMGMKFNELYNEAQNTVGYGANPFEFAPRRQGTRARESFEKTGQISGHGPKKNKHLREINMLIDEMQQALARGKRIEIKDVKY